MNEKSKAYLNITKYNRLYGPFSFVLDYMGFFPLFLTLWAFFLCSRLYGPFSFVLDYMGLFPLFSTSNIFSINEMTLILKIISHHEVKHVMVLSISRLTYDLKVLTYIIISITGSLVRPTGIIVIMAALTFKKCVIL